MLTRGLLKEGDKAGTSEAPRLVTKSSVPSLTSTESQSSTCISYVSPGGNYQQRMGSRCLLDSGALATTPQRCLRHGDMGKAPVLLTHTAASRCQLGTKCHSSQFRIGYYLCRIRGGRNAGMCQ